jgi:hypothetical protein
MEPTKCSSRRTKQIGKTGTLAEPSAQVMPTVPLSNGIQPNRIRNKNVDIGSEY